MKPKKRIYCPIIHRSKMLFESEEKANRFIEFNEDDIRKTGSVKFKNLRAYYCIACGGWHITHASINEKEIREKDERIERAILSAKELEEKKKNRIKEEESKKKSDAYEFVKAFDLKSFGGKKKFKKYLSENPDLIPTSIPPDKIYHVIKELPPEYFSNDSDSDIKNEDSLSDSEVEKYARSLYDELPFDKLTDKSLVKQYIKWEFRHKRDIPVRIIKELEKLCEL